MTTLENTLCQTHDWAVDQMHFLCELNQIENAHSIQCEFSEWLDPSIDHHDVLSLEFIGEV